MNKGQTYYARFAKACDHLLQEHPLGTNDLIRLAGNDPSLPEIIRDLKPQHITISHDRVHLLVGVSRVGFGVGWGSQPELQANWWALTIYREGDPKVLFVEIR